MKILSAKIISGFILAAGLGANFANEASPISEQKYEVSHKLYEFDTTNNYVISDNNLVSQNVLGSNSIGRLTISGNITQKTKFRNDEAYGVNGKISFSYNYYGAYQTSEKTDWNIMADTCTSIDNQTLSGSIAKGALIVQKSYDGDIWNNAVNPIVNYYEDNKSGSSNFYTSSGEDVNKGVYYRMIFAYELGRKIGESGALWWKDDVFEYKRYAEVYTCYVSVDMPANITLHNYSVEASDLNYEGYSVELLSAGETLNDGDTTIKGFRIDTLGADYLIGVTKNGGFWKYVKSGFGIFDNGKYRIEIISKVGSTAIKNVYVFDGGSDRGFNTYFGDYFINGERVYRDGDYPTFAKNSCFHVNAVNENIPALTGQLINLTTNETILFDGKDRTMRNIALSAGAYTGTLYSGNGTGGSFFKYTFNFNILGEESKPYVNYRNLINTSRLCDLTSKHYEVAYQTTKGGYVFVCFSMNSYNDALKYAYEIEKRFIEKAEDGYLYYKSTDNPNKKIKYIDNIELTQALNYYAKQNVEINYFNPLDSFTYKTYDNDLLESLESLNITESIKVFPNKEEKNKLISRMPYINDFTFISIADYDSVTVTAKCYRNGQTYSIKYGIPLNEQLTVTSKYLITETNKYGKFINYDVYFANDNQTTSSWSVTNGGVSEKVNVSSATPASGNFKITGDSVSLLSISNAFDQDCIVTIKAPSVYSYEIKCLISELGNMTLYKKGTYYLDFIDRVGNKYEIVIDITGNTRYSEAFDSTSDKICYTNVYNNSHLNKISMGEEIIYDSSELKAAIDRKVNGDLYTVASYTNYCNCLKAAKEVYNNPAATQAEINTATENLNNAYKGLVLTADKTELHALLNNYEKIDDALYTSTSYANLTKAYNESMIIYLKDDPSNDEVDKAVKKLKVAFLSLVERGKKDQLKLKLEAISKVDCNQYTPQTISALNDVYNEAYKIYIDVDATQEQIDDVIQKLDEAYGLLVYRADFSALLAEIKNAQALNKDKYTTASWNALIIQYNNAVAIYKDFNNKQSDVNLAVFNLKQAINSLVMAGDSKNLQSLVDEIASIDSRIYTSETVSRLKEKYQEAQNAIAEKYEQKKLDKIEAELKQLKEELSIREDKVELKNKLEEILVLDESITDDSTHSSLVKAYNKALEVLNNVGASEEEVQTSISELNAEIEKANKSKDGEKSGFKWKYVIIGAAVVVAVIILIIVISLFN